MVDRVRRESRLEREAEGGEKEGLDTGIRGINPGTGETIPIWLANFVLPEYGTGAIMAVPAHDQRDFEFARQYGLPIRLVYRARGARPDPDPATLAGPIPHGGVLVRSGTWDGTPAGAEAISVAVALARGEGLRARPSRLPAARLADLAAALLGHADPGDLLPGLRRRAGPGSRPAGAPSRRRRVPRARGQPARAVRGVRPDDVPEVRRAGAPRDRHDGHVRRLVLVLPALPRPGRRDADVRSGARRELDAGRPVHRRHRARDPAPALRALHLPRAPRHGPGRHRGAVRAALQPGNDHAPQSRRRARSRRCRSRAATRCRPTS